MLLAFGLEALIVAHFLFAFFLSQTLVQKATYTYYYLFSREKIGIICLYREYAYSMFAYSMCVNAISVAF
jgi:hypothetical protein